MAVRSRLRPAHWVVLVLVLAPAWKIVERIGRPGPKPVSAEASAAGRELFVHEWTQDDALTSGDGLGPVFNARSCVECHHQAGAGGGGPVARNVVVYGLVGDSHGLPPSGVVHQQATRPEYQETLHQVHDGLPVAPSIPLADLLDRSRPRPPGVVITQRNTPALFGDGLIDAISDEAIIAHQREHSTPARLVGLNGARDAKIRGRVARLADGRIGRFGWKLEFATLNDFVKAACANEIGLSNPGNAQATPLARRDYQAGATDLTDAQCLLMTDYIRALPAPTESIPDDPHAGALAQQGRKLFDAIGCADCHSQSLGPVAGIYSDMLLHEMGADLESSTGYYGGIILVEQSATSNAKFAASEQPKPGEWRTAPLWGVADSAPYLHDGRAETLDRAVGLHGGEATDVADRFKAMPEADRAAVVAFLKTLRAPGPVATIASK